jgi:ceramide glucosyltransferase
MGFLLFAYIAWLSLMGIGVSAAMVIGAWKRLGKRDCSASGDLIPRCGRLEILIPVAGSFPDQETILTTLLEQSYRPYEVMFIVESDADPANAVVDRLCHSHPRARKVVSGLASGCAQKNHNLIAGVGALRPDTEIILFCDSSNRADPDWLARFLGPLQTSEAEVITTFRVFHPEPETVGGVSQAMYAAFLRLFAVIKPTPWGGATAIRRATFDRLNVVAAWSRTVIDDLVLGNVLAKAVVKVHMDPCNLLTSPLSDQSLQGFLSYLDRQILFPKFTNPGLWITTVTGVTGLAFAVITGLLAGIAFALGGVSAPVGWVSLGFLSLVFANLLALWGINESPISLKNWLLAFFPCISCAAFLCVRSIFMNHIDWHGRRYHTGKEGIVRLISRLNDRGDEC